MLELDLPTELEPQSLFQDSLIDELLDDAEGAILLAKLIR